MKSFLLLTPPGLIVDPDLLTTWHTGIFFLLRGNEKGDYDCNP
jgi:hypothetical protein